MKHPHLKKHLRRYRITDGSSFRLKDHDPGDTGHLKLDQHQAESLLAEGVAKLSNLQTQLYADDRWSLLAVFQAMDAGGKDSCIKHVMTGVNPQGVEVTAFKHPGPEALAQDYLWRVHAKVPARGRIGIFNRSHYEEVLIARVHPEILAAQRVPGDGSTDKFWRQRFEDIVAFETYLHRQGIMIQKFFLHLSKDEQRRRFLARLDEPDKHWKFSTADLHERKSWDAYQHAYEAAIQATSTKQAPWYVIPADNKWLSQLMVVEALVETLESLKLRLPEPAPGEAALLQAARTALEAE